MKEKKLIASKCIPLQVAIK